MLRYKIWLVAVIALTFTTQCTSSPAVTPTRTYNSTDKILFLSASGNSGWDLFTENADGTGLKQLTSLKNLIGNVAWSPDGQYIAFTTFPNGFGLNLILNVMNADGSGLRQLSNDTTGGVAWAPDSQRIAFVSKRDGLREIYVINRDGTGEKRVTHGNTNEYMNDVYDLSWSPDGNQIAFIRLYVLSMVKADGSGEKVIRTVSGTTTAVAWSPDGKQVAFVLSLNPQTAIYTISPDGSNFHKVIDIPDDFASLGWSPDGQHLDYTQKNNGSVSVFVVDADGKNNHEIASGIASYSWSSDSKQLAYSVFDASLQSAMYTIDAEGQDRKTLPGNNANDQAPMWSPAH